MDGEAFATGLKMLGLVILGIGLVLGTVIGLVVAWLT